MSKRYLSPGVTEYGQVFVEVEYSTTPDGGRLSITGVEGPKNNGDARGSCGQIVDTLSRLKSLSPGWTPEQVVRLRAEWERWHLNDMRAGCEHQIKAGWGTRPIDPAKPLDAYGNHTGHGSTWNMLTWVSPKEHPDGLLGVACEVC